MSALFPARRALLSGADADCLSVFDVADRVALRIFQRDQSDDQVAFGFVREVLVLRRDISQQAFVQFDFVASLFERDAEYILVFDRGRAVGRVDLDDVVRPFPFVLQYC